ncbi:MAG: zinc transporter ZntB [Deltaproteobacteria bacterium]|nr:zinc transporter ZntB [Deltaproteobacteria bacterium]
MISTLQFNKSSALAYLLDGNGGTRTVDTNEIAAWTPQDGNLWVHLNYNNSEEIKWLTDSSALEPLVVEALLAEETRPRTTVIGDGLLIALRGVNLNPGADPEDMVSIRLWVDSTRIVTTRKRELISVTDLINQFNTKKGPCNSAEFLVELVDRLIWRMSETVDQFEDRVAELEEMVLAVDSSSLRYELATLRRQAISIRRYLAPEREALSRLIIEKVSWLDDGSRLQLREVNDRLIRHIEDIDAVRERAAVTQEELQSRLSEQMNSRMYVLSVVAAIFLPLGFLTGLLGVNVGGIPGTDYPMAFLVFTGMLVVVVVLQVLLFRWKKWM